MSFTFDLRSQDEALLSRFAAFLQSQASDMAARRWVDIYLGTSTQAAASPISPDIQQGLIAAAHACGITHMEIPSGEGHGCATFASLGVPSGMISIRNSNASRNSNEAMEFDDFARATDVLAQWVLMVSN